MIVSSSVKAEQYQWDLYSVVDGDTVKFKVDFLPKPLKPIIAIRLLGIDTPEKTFRAKCSEESILAEKASAFTKSILANSTDIRVDVKSWDKYGGRMLGEIYVDGKRLSVMLIEKGLAVPYDGKKKKSWC